MSITQCPNKKGGYVKNCAICLTLLANPFKRSPRGILNSAIPFLIASTFQRIYPYQRTAFRETEDLFSAVGNGNGATDRGQFQWLFLTFDPVRLVAGCPSAIRRKLSGSTLRHVQCIIDEPQSLLRINAKDVYTSNILTIFADISDSLLTKHVLILCAA